VRWSELSADARRYILYHALASPVLITWYALPFYLMRVGYSVLEVGALFTTADLLAVPVTLVLGGRFARVDLRLGLAAIDAMEAVSLILFSLAFVFRRMWLFSIMGRWEASTVSVALSSLRRALGIVSPLLAGALAALDPRAPYAACLALLAATIPVYGVAAVGT